MSNTQMASVNHILLKKNHIDARLPFYASELAVGADLFAVIDNKNNELTIAPNHHKLIKTGLELARMDENYELQIRPRSGLALRGGITVLNTPGTIDPDYRGEIGVILLNTSDCPFVVRTGDRIAQLVVAKRYIATFQYTDNISQTIRGSNGFGSTGVSGAVA